MRILCSPIAAKRRLLSCSSCLKAPSLSMRIRTEEPADMSAVRDVNIAAFETAAEADLVDLLRAQASPIVARRRRQRAHRRAHPVLSGDARWPFGAADHGPRAMAVLPANQRTGIGSALVRDGLERCRLLGAGAVVVFGHADYYPRFGFAPASRFGLRSGVQECPTTSSWRSSFSRAPWRGGPA